MIDQNSKEQKLPAERKILRQILMIFFNDNFLILKYLDKAFS